MLTEMSHLRPELIRGESHRNVSTSRAQCDHTAGAPQCVLGAPAPASVRKSFGSLSAGVQAGYNRVLPSRLLLGVEADLTVLTYLSGDDLAWFRTTPDTD